jgi:hypothetical protein
MPKVFNAEVYGMSVHEGERLEGVATTKEPWDTVPVRRNGATGRLGIL